MHPLGGHIPGWAARAPRPPYTQESTQRRDGAGEGADRSPRAKPRARGAPTARALPPRDDPAVTGAAGAAPAPTPRRRFVDRRLWAIGILLPVGFAIVLEVVRWQLERHGVWSPGVFEAWHVAGLAVVVVGIVTFAVFMFRLIDHTERQVLSQNRDLTAANAVAAAIQGQATVPAIVDSALEALLRTSGARQARIRFLESAGLPERDAQPRTLTAPGSPRRRRHPHPRGPPGERRRRWSGGWRSGTRTTPTSPTASAAPPCRA